MFSLRAAGIGVLLVLASFSSVGQASASSLSPRYHPGSTGPSVGEIGTASTPEPDYDEQIGATFVQSLTSLTFNVTALAQTATDGYGPAYILNGLTSEGYWYQVGVSYHWPSTNGGYDSGFGFNYQVYAPNDRSVYPSEGSGLGTFSKTVDSGDTVLLSLTFSGGSVLMSADDLETGGVAEASYSAFGSTTFVGNTAGPSNSAGYFTGIMTEWYHVGEYTGSEGKVTYTDDSVTLSGAWLWADEFDSASASTPPVFDNQTKDIVVFDGSNVYPFESNGATIYGSAHQFVTGLLNSATSDVMFKPANAQTAATTFEASYMLAGLQQTSDIATGTPTVIEADPGTSITVTANSTADGGLEKWVFSGTSGSSVSIPAGNNATYVYYELAEETVSDAVVAGGAPTPFDPELFYTIPGSIPESGGSGETTIGINVTSSPQVIFAMIGTGLNIDNITTSSERWATLSMPPNGWTVSAPNVLPNPISYYQQFEVGVAYWLNETSSGSSSAPSTPSVTSTAFGQPVTVPVDQPEQTSVPAPQLPSPYGVFGGEYIGWFDAGSTFSMPSVLNGTASDRWVGAQWAGQNGSASEPLTQSNVFTWDYTHQFYLIIGSYDPQGGTVAPSSGWFDAGTAVRVIATANQGWQFESWVGTGRLFSNSSEFPISVTGALSANATFYAGLTMTAGQGVEIRISDECTAVIGAPAAVCTIKGSQLISPGISQTVYLPPHSTLDLTATPANILYSFASWKNSTSTSKSAVLSEAIDGPTELAASSAYNPVSIGAIAIAALVVITALSLLVRRRRRRLAAYGPWP